MALTTLAMIGIGLSAVGTFASISAQNKAAEAARKQEANTRRRSARQAIRQAQIMRAQQAASAGASGAGGSSGQFGGAGAIGSQVGGALGFSSTQSALSGIITTQNQRANIAGAISSFGSTLFSMGGGFSGGSSSAGAGNLANPAGGTN